MPSKTKAEQLSIIKETFSLRAVKARYKTLGHTPVRGVYDCHGKSCLLGSFEHMMGVSPPDQYGDSGEKCNSTWPRGSAVFEILEIDQALTDAMEAGWEGWTNPRVRGRAGTAVRAAYEHGAMLALKLEPEHVR